MEKLTIEQYNVADDIAQLETLREQIENIADKLALSFSHSDFTTQTLKLDEVKDDITSEINLLWNKHVEEGE